MEGMVLMLVVDMMMVVGNIAVGVVVVVVLENYIDLDR